MGSKRVGEVSISMWWFVGYIVFALITTLTFMIVCVYENDPVDDSEKAILSIIAGVFWIAVVPICSAITFVMIMGRWMRKILEKRKGN